MSTRFAAPDATDVSSGVLLAQLLLEAGWVHRRVESLRMDANGGTRLLVSLDITLPDPGIARGSDRVLIPFALVQKGALRKVDTFDHAGRPMPVLDTNDNGRLVAGMLVALGRSVLPERVTTSKRYEATLQDVVYCALEDAWVQVARFRGWLSAFGLDPDAPEHEVFTSLVSQFSSHFLLAVEAEAELVAKRMVVKYSYEDPLPELRGRRRVPMTLERVVGNYAMAASYHFEVEAPGGIGFRWLQLYESQADGSGTELMSTDEAQSPGTPEVVLHVACRPGHRFTKAVVEAGLAPPAGGLVSVAVFGALIATACVILGAAYSVWPDKFVEGRGVTMSPVASLLLAGPALLLSWLSRAPEHRMVARVLWPVRSLLVQTSLSLFGLAFVLAVPLAGPWNGILWMSIVVLQGITVAQAVRLALAVRRSE